MPRKPKTITAPDALLRLVRGKDRKYAAQLAKMEMYLTEDSYETIGVAPALVTFIRFLADNNLLAEAVEIARRQGDDGGPA
jgi:hypothetical protein